MYRIQVFLAVSVVLLAAGALATSSAAACGTGEWCISTKGLKTGESAELAKTTAVTKLELSVPSVGVKGKCTSFEAQKAFLTGPNTGKAAALVFSGCTITGAEACAFAKSTITSNALKSGPAATLGTKEGESITSPETGTVLGVVELVGESCALAGKQPITGKVKEIAPTGQVESAEQLIVAKTGEGEVKIGSAAALLAVEQKIKLVSGSKMALG
jgi:hypothetical protein